jgi:putative ABC transport system permease protein
MLKNALKTAYAVYMRRKAFTAISLFGTVMTLTMLILVVAVIDSTIYPDGAEKNSERHLLVSRLDASPKDLSNYFYAPTGVGFLESYVRPMKKPKRITIFSENNNKDMYVEGIKYEFLLRFTDDIYWQVFDFNLIEGRLVNQHDYEKGMQVAVINQSTANLLFPNQSAIGQSLTIVNNIFSIIGIIEDESIVQENVASDIWLVHSANPQPNTGFLGNYRAVLEAHNESGLSQIKEEYAQVVRTIDYQPDQFPGQFQVWYSYAESKLDKLARDIFDNTYREKAKTKSLAFFVGLAGVAFMLLPALNLMNLNISRIMERRCEIGVKRSFGATTKNLVVQLLVENVTLTMIGGFFSMVLALLCIYIFNYVEPSIALNSGGSWFSFLASTLVISVFGIVSGIVPAWKMAKLHPVQALKGV